MTAIPPQFAFFLCGIVALAAVCAVWFIFEARAGLRERHARTFADPADTTDPDGSIWVHALHHEELPAAGRLAMVPVRPPDDTAPLPHAVGTWGMAKDELLDQLARTYMTVTR